MFATQRRMARLGLSLTLSVLSLCGNRGGPYGNCRSLSQCAFYRRH